MKTDPPHILCVNPWIHDFAAFDFWARPLGLLSLAALLRDNGARISFLDCASRFHPGLDHPGKIKWDGRGPFLKTPIPLPRQMADQIPDETRTFSRYGIPPELAARDLAEMNRSEADRPDLVLVTSLMTYWASGVTETIALIKENLPGVPVVLGGIYASLCTGHAREFSGADEVISGPGEAVLANLVETYTGFRPERMENPEDLDSLPFPALDLGHGIPYAPILTSRGCPFSCEYCASSYLEPRLRRRSPGHVFREIMHWHTQFGVVNFPFYDDALLVGAKEYAFPLFEDLISSGADLNFHTPNALHIREISARAADLMFRAGFKTIRLGLETTDFGSARSHDAKVKQEEFDRAVCHLKAAGFKREQIGAYLLCGLPDQNLDDVERSMALVRDQGILPVLAYYTPIPHTPMWEEAVARARYDITAHPGLTNNSLFPCVGSQEERGRISQLKKLSN